MINITRNKELFAKQMLQQTKQLEGVLLRQTQSLLSKTFFETARAIKDGDPLNLVPIIVNKHSAELSLSLLNNYRRVGTFVFKSVMNRLQEVRPKRIEDYYIKDSYNSFWFYFDNWAKGQAVAKVTLINSTTREILRTIIENGIRASKSYAEIAKDIRKLSPITSRNRAMMIAATETHTAFNKSTFESIESGDVKIETKEWLNAGDDRVRNGFFSHVNANGEVVSMNDKFVKTGEALLYPGDANGSASNIIRCRCFTIFNTEVTTIE